MHSKMNKVLSIILFCALVCSVQVSADWFSLDKTTSNISTPHYSITSSSPDSLTVHFTLPGFELKRHQIEGDVYQELKIPGITSSGTVGNPFLPQWGKLLAIPLNAQVEVEVSKAPWVKIPLTFTLFPYQEKPCRCSSHKKPEFVKNETIYAKNQTIPTQSVFIEWVGKMNGIRIARLVVNPFRYNPVKNALEVCSSTTIILRYRTDGSIPRHYLSSERPMSQSMLNIITSSVINGELIKEEFEQTKSRIQPERMLIIAHDPFLSAINPLVEWKKQKGLIVDVVSVSSVGNTVNAIKSYIQNAYDSWSPPPTYVLLVGNENTVVPDHRPTSNGNAASDYPYSLLSGTDILPDILIGRIVAESEADVDIQVAKIIGYEKNPSTGTAANWYHKGAGIASNEGSNPSDEEYIGMVENGLRNGTYTQFDHFFQGNGTATMANINNAINGGRSWLTYIGHGSGTSWGSTNGTYDNNSVYALSNGYKLPVLIDVACENGSFDETWKCFGEAWMESGTAQSPKGAVGYYGGTVSISWDPPAVMAVGCAIRHFSNPVYSWGGTLLAGQMYLIEQMGTGTDVEDNLEWYIVFGDPSLVLRTDNPTSISVQTNPQVLIGQTSITATVTQNGKIPVPNARVAVYSPAENIFGYALTNASGIAYVTLSSPPSQPGSMFLTVTGYNIESKQMTLSVIPGNEPFIVVHSATVDDAGIGNGNGIGEFNETVYLTLMVENIGNQNANNVNVHITSNDNYVTILDQDEPYGLITAHQTSAVSRGFQFKIAPNVPNGHQATFTVLAENGQQQWTDTTAVTLYAPSCNVSQITVEDFQGDGDHQFDADEQGALNITLVNNGGSAVMFLAGTLSTQDAYVTITQDSYLFPPLQANGGQAYGVFNIRTAPNTPIGHNALFNLALSHSSGFQQNLSFHLKIGSYGAYIYKAAATSTTASVLADYFNRKGISFQQGDSLPTDINQYDRVFVLLGIYSTNHTLSSSEGTALANYLDQGGSVYMEGGDTWSYDTATEVHPYFHINGVSDGASDTSTIVGVNGTFTEGMQFQYVGTNQWMDRLSAGNGAVTLFQNVSPAYDNGICYSNNTYRTIGCSFELGGLQPVGKTGQLDPLFDQMMNFLSPVEVTAQTPTLQHWAILIFMLFFSILLIPSAKQRR